MSGFSLLSVHLDFCDHIDWVTPLLAAHLSCQCGWHVLLTTSLAPVIQPPGCHAVLPTRYDTCALLLLVVYCCHLNSIICGTYTLILSRSPVLWCVSLQVPWPTEEDSISGWLRPSHLSTSLTLSELNVLRALPPIRVVWWVSCVISTLHAHFWPLLLLSAKEHLEISDHSGVCKSDDLD